MGRGAAGKGVHITQQGIHGGSQESQTDLCPILLICNERIEERQVGVDEEARGP